MMHTDGQTCQPKINHRKVAFNIKIKIIGHTDEVMCVFVWSSDLKLDGTEGMLLKQYEPLASPKHVLQIQFEMKDRGNKNTEIW